LSSLVEHKTSSFAKDMCLYKNELCKNELCPEALVEILKLIIYDGMVCLRIFGGGVLMYVNLVSHILHFFNYCWPVFRCMIFDYGFSSNCKRQDVKS